MDWGQTITVIGVFIGGFFYMMNRMDNKFEHLGERIGKVENKLTSIEGDIKNLGQRIDNTNQHIDGINQRITDLKADMNQRLSTIEGYLIPKKIFRFEEPHKEETEEPKEN